jgi:tRNA wybutosine-synthesizing protein 4
MEGVPKESSKKQAKKAEDAIQKKLNVARTNDESVVSKRSAAREYFADPFLAHFVRKPAKRAALINRGYYIRRQSVMIAVEHFLNQHGSACQIVSLGAGFDTLFFVLSTMNKLPQRFFEVDFPNVVKNKSILIEGTPALQDVIGKASIDPDSGEVENERYALLCGDLCDFAAVKLKLQKHKLSFELPTLFLAECVFTYMANADSDRILYWAASAPFPVCLFVVYEQIKPNDAFGRTMQANLHARGSDLLGIHGYPTAAAEDARFRKLGFSSVRIRTMMEVYLSDLPKEERARIDSMEEFDEHEEWREKCGHYVLAYASTSKSLPLPFSDKGGAAVDLSSVEPAPFVESVQHQTGRSSELKRWGHSACAAGGGRVIIFGGYGGGARHERLNSVAVLSEGVVTLPSVTGVVPSARVLHGCCMLTEDRMLVYGGRSGPSAPMNDVFMLDCNAMRWKKLTFLPAASPPPRFRHSLTRCSDAPTLALSFGGRFGWKHGEESNEVWLIDAQGCRLIPYADKNVPAPRSSHAACWHKGALFIHGGLNDTEDVLSDLWRLTFDAGFTKCFSERVEMSGLPSRFSHSAVPLADSILLVAGQNETLENSLFVCDSSKRVVKGPFPIAHEVWSRTRAVGFGSSVLLVGGGLTCFSFGTSFCDDTVIVLGLREPVEDVIQSRPRHELHVVEEARPDGRHRVAIPRLNNPTREQFRDRVQKVREPCIFSGSPDVPKWSKADIVSSVPADTLASIHVCDGPLLDFANKNFRFEVVPFGEMLDRMEQPNAHLYFRSLGENARKDPSNMSESFPNLASKFLVPDFAKDLVVPGATVHSSCLRFSSDDIQMWTHYDINDNILVGLRGRKRLALFHPEEIRHLYADGTASAVLDVENPDLSKFPLFAKAVVWEGVLEEGDVLFIPAMWWHNVRTLSVCYGLNVFFRHLPEDSYQPNDLYGNKDPLLAVAAEKSIKQAISSLSELPEEYRRFFARKLILEMKKGLL